jgi:hypothetical protein
MRVSAQAIGLLLALGPGLARAETDWFASIYTPAGVELRADPRVFTLYALLNRAGYDVEVPRREHPVPVYEYPAARARVRQALASAKPAVLEHAQAYFDAHPEPVERYLAATLGAGEGLKDLDGLLTRVEAEWPVADLRAETFEAYRAVMRAYTPSLDAPLQRTWKLLRVPEGERAVRVVVNLLEAEGSIRGLRTREGVVLVVGPAVDVESVIREYARLLLAPKVGERVAERWTQGPALLSEARALGAREGTVGEYAVALLGRAAALSAVNAPDSAYEAAGREGYFGLRELARSFEDSRPVDAWAQEGLGRVVSGRPLRK